MGNGALIKLKKRALAKFLRVLESLKSVFKHFLASKSVSNFSFQTIYK